MIRTGDIVMLTCDNRTVEAQVLLASPNGRSLMLGFEAMLFGHVGMMPVLRDEDGRYYSLIGGHQIMIEERQ